MKIIKRIKMIETTKIIKTINYLNKSFLSLVLVIVLVIPSTFIVFNQAMALDEYSSIFSLKNNESVIGVASKREITRINFDHEIEQLQGIADELEYNVVGRDLYLRVAADKPVNFFVKLEHDLTYRFSLLVKDIPACQIFVKSKDAIDLANANNTTKTIYQGSVSEGLKARISKMIEIALKPKKDIGYEIIKDNKKLYSNIPGISMHKLGVIRGEMLVIEKIYLTNNSQNTKTLQAGDFLAQNNENNIVVYLSSNSLAPGERSVLLKISAK